MTLVIIVLSNAKLDLKLEVEDQVGNKSVYKATLFRKPQP